MKKIISNIQAEWSNLSIFFIILIACFFRFYNYYNRWGLAYDQAQFSVVARYALETFQIPLLGPFSSGGPFQTGGEWYWIVMLGTVFYPNNILSPWIFVTLLTILAVFVMFLVGRVYKNKLFGLFLGLLTAVSPAQIHQSTNLTNQTPIVFFSSLSLLFVLLFVKRKKNIFIFLAALSVGFGSAVHIQAVALIPFILLAPFLFRRNLFQSLVLIFLGLGIPWLPVLVADSYNNFYNTRQMIYYFTGDQAKVPYEVLGRRWLTFILDFIPNSWGQIIGGYKLIGAGVIIGLGIVVVERFLSRKIRKEAVLILLSLSIMFIILRYIRTPLFESFFVFIHPFIIFMSGWLFFKIYKKVKIVGSILLILILLTSIFNFWEPINKARNNTFKQAEELKNMLYRRYENQAFSIYDYGANNSSISMPLVLSLYMDRRVGDEGRKIGLYRSTKDSWTTVEGELIYGEGGSLQIYDLSASASPELVDLGWNNYNPKTVFNETQYWFKNK